MAKQISRAFGEALKKCKNAKKLKNYSFIIKFKNQKLKEKTGYSSG